MRKKGQLFESTDWLITLNREGKEERIIYRTYHLKELLVVNDCFCIVLSPRQKKKHRLRYVFQQSFALRIVSTQVSLLLQGKLMDLLYTYENEDEISSDLKCVICLEPYRSPVSDLRCGHVFCCQCIQSWLKQRRSCPLCRHEFKGFSPLGGDQLWNELQRLPVRCNHCQTGDIDLAKFPDHKLHDCPEKVDVDRHYI